MASWQLTSLAICCLAALASGFLTDDGKDICHGLDCPHFTVLNKTADWELRRYNMTRWVATNGTAMEKDDISSTLFRTLFNYIDGGNVDGVKIPMTAPVLTKVIHGAGPNCKSDFIMHFMLPYAFWSKPVMPSNPAVTIQEIPAMDVFVKSFGGFAKDEDYVKNLADLASSLTSSGVPVEDTFFYEAGYDGPYTFFNRHNEVWIQKM